LQRRIRDKISYDDLESETSVTAPALSLTRVDRYLHGPTAGSAESSETPEVAAVPPEVIRRLGRAMQVPLGTSHQSPAALINPSQAINTLGELTPGGALMKGFQQDSLASKYFFSSSNCMTLDIEL
jgi:transcription initiation factor TFIIH subunit 1